MSGSGLTSLAFWTRLLPSYTALDMGCSQVAIERKEIWAGRHSSNHKNPLFLRRQISRKGKKPPLTKKGMMSPGKALLHVIVLTPSLAGEERNLVIPNSSRQRIHLIISHNQAKKAEMKSRHPALNYLKTSSSRLSLSVSRPCRPSLPLFSPPPLSISFCT